MTNTADRTRQPKGSPNGGEFAAEVGAEASGIELGGTLTDVEEFDWQIKRFFKHCDPFDEDGELVDDAVLLEELLDSIPHADVTVMPDYDALVRANHAAITARAAEIEAQIASNTARAADYGIDLTEINAVLSDEELFEIAATEAYFHHRAVALGEMDRAGLDRPCMPVEDIEQDVAADTFDGVRVMLRFAGLDTDGHPFDAEKNPAARPAYTAHVFMPDDWDNPVATVPTKVAADNPDANYDAIADLFVISLPYKATDTDTDSRHALVAAAAAFGSETLATTKEKGVWGKAELLAYTSAQNKIHDLRHALTPERRNAASNPGMPAMVLEHLRDNDEDETVRAAAAATLGANHQE